MFTGATFAHADTNYEYESSEGYHAEEWYDPADWFNGMASKEAVIKKLRIMNATSVGSGTSGLKMVSGKRTMITTTARMGAETMATTILGMTPQNLGSASMAIMNPITIMTLPVT